MTKESIDALKSLSFYLYDCYLELYSRESTPDDDLYELYNKINSLYRFIFSKYIKKEEVD